MTTQISSPPTPAGRQRLRPSCGSRQIDLFGDTAAELPMKIPAWRELPEETRSILTSLLVRLILEHAQASSAVSHTEISHDL